MGQGKPLLPSGDGCAHRPLLMPSQQTQPSPCGQRERNIVFRRGVCSHITHFNLVPYCFAQTYLFDILVCRIQENNIWSKLNYLNPCPAWGIFHCCLKAHVKSQSLPFTLVRHLNVIIRFHKQAQTFNKT